MTWHDYSLARQYLLETHIGTRVREAQREEEAAVKHAKKHLRR